MVAPKTGWEEHGRWTTVEEESAFLGVLASDTAVVVSDAGRSVLGRPIWQATIGNPAGPTLLIVANVHGTEPSGRDAALALLRDVAYSTDPATQAWLASYRLVVCPDFNPDGFAIGRRQNANGLDLNWDQISLTQPESRALKRVVRDTAPLLLVDMHQYETSRTEAWHPRTGETPGGDPGLRSISGEVLDDLKTHLATEHGYSSHDYPISGIRWAGTVGSALAYHTVAILSEARFSLPDTDKVALGRAVLDRAMHILATRHTDLAAAVAASRAAITAATGPIPYPDREFIGTTDPATTPDPGAYMFLGWQPPQELLDLHGITSNPDGSIPTAQPARLIIAALFERSSTSCVVGVPEWSPPAPPDLAVRVKLGGVQRVIDHVFVKRDGVQREITAIYRKQDGVQRRI